MQHELPGLPRADRREPSDERLEFALRHGEHDELAALDQIRDVEHRHIGQHGRGAIAVALRHRRDAHDGVTGPGERRTDHRTHAARPDDPDAESSGLGGACVLRS